MSRDDHLLKSIVEAIGSTPLLELTHIQSGLAGRIVAKLEYLNPGASKKDRIALQIIAEARTQGLLKPGQTVVELTSGNTGTGLAIVCRAWGYPFVAVMSRGNSIERVKMMRALGAEVVLVEQAADSKYGQVSGADLERVEEAAGRITLQRGAFRADQFTLEANRRAHELHTGPEILRQAGHIDAFCDFAGTGGSFAGCARFFKSQDPRIRCFVVEPAGAPVLAGKPASQPNHSIQGGGYSMPNLTLLDRSVCDGYLTVTDQQAIAMTRRLAEEEGVFAGFSSGANVAAAVQILQGPCPGATVAVLICDSGLKYFSTNLWD